MRRFFVTVGVGAMVYTAGSVLTPQEDNLTVLAAPIIGSIFTAIVVAALLLPLRAIQGGVMTQSCERSRALVAAGLLVGLVTAVSVALSPASLPHGRLSFWALWSIYAVTVVLSFWPFRARSTVQ